MTRIKYNKERLSGKQIGGGGPRDKQLAQRLRKEHEMLSQISPSMSAQVSEQPTVDLSQYLPLAEVKKKLEEAVAATAESERKRFESGLKNLNDQLNAERKKVGSAQDQLINANSEIARLKAQINQFPEVSEKAQQLINEKDLALSKLRAEKDAKLELNNRINADLESYKEALLKKESELVGVKNKVSSLVEKSTDSKVKIAELEANIKAKEEISSKSSKDLEELKTKLDKLYDRIADGSIKPLVGSKMDRPALEDKIFIDPIEKNEGPKLDSHIDIKEDATSKTDSGRDINADLAKLRNLLKL
jgi:chromosome segregation ATPase